jgi:hypothetical protein
VSDSDATDVTTSPNSEAEALKALVRRNTSNRSDGAVRDEEAVGFVSRRGCASAVLAVAQ